MTGEYLTSGAFMIRGKKNYLPATHLEMGVALLFCLGDEASVERHAHDRRDLFLRQQDEENFENKGMSLSVSQSTRVELSRDVTFPGQLDADEAKDALETHDDHNIHITSIEEPSIDDEHKGENLGSDHAYVDSQNERMSSTFIEVLAEVDEASLEPTLSRYTEENENRRTLNLSNETSIGFTARDGSTYQAATKRGLSVKDRKLIKKYGSLEAAEKAMSRLKELELKAVKSTGISYVNNDTSSTALSRGKKSKMKKIEKKYSEQDDEDRVSHVLITPISLTTSFILFLLCSYYNYSIRFGRL